MLHSQNWSREDSRGFISALQEAIISPPPMKTGRTDQKMNEWDEMYYKSLNEQL